MLTIEHELKYMFAIKCDKYPTNLGRQTGG